MCLLCRQSEQVRLGAIDALSLYHTFDPLLSQPTAKQQHWRPVGPKSYIIVPSDMSMFVTTGQKGPSNNKPLRKFGE